MDVKIKEARENQEKIKVKESLARTESQNNKKLTKKFLNKLKRMNNQRNKGQQNVKEGEEEVAKVNNDHSYFKLLIIVKFV